MSKARSSLAIRLKKSAESVDEPLWSGPCADGPNGGITQSMLSAWLVCRERFRVKYVLGLQTVPRFNRAMDFGNMWHAAEEGFAAAENGDPSHWMDKLDVYTKKLLTSYPSDQAEIIKWRYICGLEFVEYVKYWAGHPDVAVRTPLMQEQVFDVPYQLPSGRVVRLRGKFDSVDLIDAHESYPKGIWLQENKSKSKLDVVQIQRNLKFDLQTMLYLIALNTYDVAQITEVQMKIDQSFPLLGVRYNVVRRDCPIKQHEGRQLKSGWKPGETTEAWLERLRSEYIAADPHEWFFRWKSRVTDADIQAFKSQFLDPCLEQLCWWYDLVVGVTPSSYDNWEVLIRLVQSLNYRLPFGIYNPLIESGFTEYDEFLASGSTVGLRRAESFFPELQEDV